MKKSNCEDCNAKDDFDMLSSHRDQGPFGFAVHHYILAFTQMTADENSGKLFNTKSTLKSQDFVSSSIFLSLKRGFSDLEDPLNSFQIP